MLRYLFEHASDTISAKLPEGPIRAFLVELEEHLAVLLEYVGGHFKPVYVDRQILYHFKR